MRRNRVNNIEPEVALETEAWGNKMIEANPDCPARCGLVTTTAGYRIGGPLAFYYNRRLADVQSRTITALRVV